MKKKKKVRIECDHCQEICTIHFSKKVGTVQCCPFCAEDVTVMGSGVRPLLNSFEDLDSFNERDYEDEDEEDGEDEE